MKDADLQKSLLKSVTRNSLSLGLFAMFTVGLISLTYVLTQERIADQIRAYEARALMEILPPGTHDNVLLDSKVTLQASVQLGTLREREAYVAYKSGKAVAVIMPVIAPDGYNGRIEMLVGINSDGSIAGVRAITHRETPGLGDKINTNVTDWIMGFNGKSLGNPSPSNWAVRKDGGEFDQFAGATITPRAVVASVYRALEYFKANKKHLLSNKLQEAQ